MKETIGKYLFEIVVIFLGITSSFLFEEWRQNREKDEKAIDIVKSLLVELERNANYIRHADTLYMETNSFIQKLLKKEDVTKDETVDISYVLLEETSKFRLKEISSFIHGFSSNDQIDIINRNKEVLRYLTYMESLLAEHELITNSISEFSSSKLWPLLNKYQLTDDILNLQKEQLEFDDLFLEEVEEDLLNFFVDEEVRQNLKWSQLKILRLIQVNDAIHTQIENIVRELNRTIDGE